MCIRDRLGSDYTRAITRGQFAALAVRYYETLMGDSISTIKDKIPSGNALYYDCLLYTSRCV